MICRPVLIAAYLILFPLGYVSVDGASAVATEMGLHAAPPILAGMAIDPAGHVYVTDTRGGRIYVLSHNLQPLAVWTVPRPTGSVPVHLADVAIDRHAIFASDLNGRIFRLTRRGKVRAVWGSPGRGRGRFEQPWGIAVGTRGNLLVVDAYNHRIQKFSPHGGWLGQWQLYSPQTSRGGPCGLQYLAINPRGQSFVTDNCYDRVLKLSARGRIVQIWQGHGSAPRQFSGPAGVAVGRHGDVFIADSFNKRIQEFTPQGKPLHIFHETGYPGYPFLPSGIAVDGHGTIYVADPENYRIFKLSPAGRTLALRCLRPAGCHGGYASP